MTRIKVKVSCNECGSMDDLEDTGHYCPSCYENKENETLEESGKELLERIYQNSERDVDGDGEMISGFNSKLEKEAFFRGFKYGIDDVAFDIADYFGIVGEWEKLSERFMKLKIDVKWPDKDNA